jgi:hypothetical protein
LDYLPLFGQLCGKDIACSCGLLRSSFRRGIIEQAKKKWINEQWLTTAQ